MIRLSCASSPAGSMTLGKILSARAFWTLTFHITQLLGFLKCLWVWQANNAPSSKDVQILISRTCKYAIFMARRNEVADGVKAVNH